MGTSNRGSPAPASSEVRPSGPAATTTDPVLASHPGHRRCRPPTFIVGRRSAVRSTALTTCSPGPLQPRTAATSPATTGGSGREALEVGLPPRGLIGDAERLQDRGPLHVRRRLLGSPRYPPRPPRRSRRHLGHPARNRCREPPALLAVLPSRPKTPSCRPVTTTMSSTTATAVTLVSRVDRTVAAERLDREVAMDRPPSRWTSSPRSCRRRLLSAEGRTAGRRPAPAATDVARGGVERHDPAGAGAPLGPVGPWGEPGSTVPKTTRSPKANPGETRALAGRRHTSAPSRRQRTRATRDPSEVRRRSPPRVPPA